jgi:hypothetical protein
MSIVIGATLSPDFQASTLSLWKAIFVVSRWKLALGSILKSNNYELLHKIIISEDKSIQNSYALEDCQL